MKKQLHIELVNPAVKEYNYNKNLMIDLFIKLEEEQQNNQDKTPASIEREFWTSNYNTAHNYLKSYEELARLYNIIIKDKFKINSSLIEEHPQNMYKIYLFDERVLAGTQSHNTLYYDRKQDIEEYINNCRECNEEPEPKYTKNPYKLIAYDEVLNYIYSLSDVNDF